jgi:hypothetical protein
MLRTNTSGTAYANPNFNVYNGTTIGTGSRSNPVPVWEGWKGPNKYYLFSASHLETANRVTSIDDLNSYNRALFGQNLSGPYSGMLRQVQKYQSQLPPKPKVKPEQTPSMPIIALPKINSDEHFMNISQTDYNIIVLAGELAAFWGLLWTIGKMKKLRE